MKIEDEIKDEKWALVLLNSFTKGYGKVPMEVYNIVLPLLFNTTFRELLIKKESLETCIQISVQKQYDLKKDIINQMATFDDITSKALGLAMLNKNISFPIIDGVMYGSYNDLGMELVEEAIILGDYLHDKSLADIISLLDNGSEKIIVLDGDTLGKDMDMSKLTDFGEVTILSDIEQEEIPNTVKEATIIITNKKLLGKKELQEANRVKLICVTATGFNNIDIAYCKEKEITVCNVKGYSTNSVAQHTFALLLDLYHKNNYYHQYVTSGKYSMNPLFTHFEETFYELEGKTWGIVGMGDIGQKVAQIAKVFGCEIQYYSTSGKNMSQPYPCVDFNTLLRTSDIISIHAPLNNQTDNLFNASAFDLMKPTAYLINVGRGKIVNELDLVEALRKKRIAGAGLDVFENEPLDKNHPLLDMSPDVLRLTPHIAWATKEARNRVIDEIYLNINAFLEGKPRNVC
ncbi:MAG: D-2-hydroxyacid dehydrogenase [Coprobacillaceae bacterium]